MRTSRKLRIVANDATPYGVDVFVVDEEGDEVRLENVQALELRVSMEDPTPRVHLFMVGAEVDVVGMEGRVPLPDEFNSVAVDWECGLGKGVPCLTPREDCEGCEHQRLAPRPGNRPWLQPNDHGEPPGGICCQRATGDHCYEHDKDNWVRVDGHWRPYARHLVKPRKAKADEG